MTKKLEDVIGSLKPEEVISNLVGRVRKLEAENTKLEGQIENKVPRAFRERYRKDQDKITKLEVRIELLRKFVREDCACFDNGKEVFKCGSCEALHVDDKTAKIASSKSQESSQD